MYWLKAGQQSLARSEAAEAVAQLRKGLGAVTGLPEEPWRWQQELDLLIALRAALAATKGFSAVEVGETIARARELSERLDRPEYIVPLSIGQWGVYTLRSEHKLALAVARQIEAIGEGQNDTTTRLLGRRAHGITRCHLGDFIVARALLEGCYDLADPAHRTIGTGMSYDPYTAMLAHLALTLASLGYIDRAQSCLNEALSEVRRLEHAFTAALVFWFEVWIDWLTGSSDLKRHAEELLAFSTKHRFPFYVGWALAYRGRSLITLGQVQEGLATLMQKLAELRSAGNVAFTPMVLTWLAEAYALLGQPAEEWDCLAEAARIVEATDERLCEAECLHRVPGDLRKAAGDLSEAERHYRQAIAVAERQSAKLFQLRASTNLARLWRDQGRHVVARNLLQPIYGWFTEGFDAPVLKEAKVLLDELT